MTIAQDVDRLLDLDLDLDVDVDETWVSAYKSDQQDYHNFYTEDVMSVQLYYLFVNRANELEQVTTNVIELQQPNKLPRENLMACIQEQLQNQTQNNHNPAKRKYKVTSILRYNVDLQPDEIMDFVPLKDDNKTTNKDTNVTNKDDAVNADDDDAVNAEDYGKRFLTLTNEKQLNDICFYPTITIFQDLNTLFVVLKETIATAAGPHSGLTRKIFIHVPKQTRLTRKRV